MSWNWATHHRGAEAWGMLLDVSDAKVQQRVRSCHLPPFFKEDTTSVVVPIPSFARDSFI